MKIYGITIVLNQGRGIITNITVGTFYFSVFNWQLMTINIFCKLENIARATHDYFGLGPRNQLFKLYVQTKVVNDYFSLISFKLNK